MFNHQILMPLFKCLPVCLFVAALSVCCLFALSVPSVCWLCAGCVRSVCGLCVRSVCAVCVRSVRHAGGEGGVGGWMGLRVCAHNGSAGYWLWEGAGRGGEEKHMCTRRPVELGRGGVQRHHRRRRKPSASGWGWVCMCAATLFTSSSRWPGARWAQHRQPQWSPWPGAC
jgi:hypothetical protein